MGLCRVHNGDILKMRNWYQTYTDLLQRNLGATEEPAAVAVIKEDREVDMAVNQLRVVQHKSEELARLLLDLEAQYQAEDVELPAWVQAKITNASHSISAVHDFMVYSEEDTP